MTADQPVDPQRPRPGEYEIDTITRGLPMAGVIFYALFALSVPLLVFLTIRALR